MILGKDIHPQKNIYYLGAIVIEILKSSDNKDDFFSLYQQVNQKENVSMNLFGLTLDWLFILGLIKNKKGVIQKCF